MFILFYASIPRGFHVIHFLIEKINTCTFYFFEVSSLLTNFLNLMF